MNMYTNAGGKDPLVVTQFYYSQTFPYLMMKHHAEIRRRLVDVPRELRQSELAPQLIAVGEAAGDPAWQIYRACSPGDETGLCDVRLQRSVAIDRFRRAAAVERQILTPRDAPSSVATSPVGLRLPARDIDAFELSSVSPRPRRWFRPDLTGSMRSNTTATVCAWSAMATACGCFPRAAMT